MRKSYRHNLRTILKAIEGRGIKTAEKMIKKELEEEDEEFIAKHRD